jgi:hypothetical protein
MKTIPQGGSEIGSLRVFPRPPDDAVGKGARTLEEFPSILNGIASKPTILLRGNDNVRADPFEYTSRHRENAMD